MNEAGVIDNHLSPYHGNYDVGGNGELLSSDVTWCPSPFFNPHPRDEMINADFSNSCWNENESGEETYYGAEEYHPWYDLWLACGGKTEAHECRGQEIRHPHSYNLPEIGVCESLFGHWPCLYR